MPNEERLLQKISEQLDELLVIHRLTQRSRLEEEVQQLLGDGTRRRIYDLCDGSNSVGDIAKALGVTSPAVSQHLAALSKARLVRQEDSPAKRYVKRLEV